MCAGVAAGPVEDAASGIGSSSGSDVSESLASPRAATGAWAGVLGISCEARRDHRRYADNKSETCKSKTARVLRRRAASLCDVDQATDPAAELRARTNGANCQARRAHPQLVLGLRGKRAGEGAGVARAVDSGFVAGNFTLFIHAAADPVERGAPPEEREDEALAEGGQHIAATDVGMLVLE